MVHSVSKVKKEKGVTKQLWQAVTTIKLREQNGKTSNWSPDINTVSSVPRPLSNLPLPWRPASRIYANRCALMQSPGGKRSQWAGTKKKKKDGKSDGTQRDSLTFWGFERLWRRGSVTPPGWTHLSKSQWISPVLGDKRVITAPQRSPCRGPWAVELASPLPSFSSSYRRSMNLPSPSNVQQSVSNGGTVECFVTPQLYLVGSSFPGGEHKGQNKSSRRNTKCSRMENAVAWGAEEADEDGEAAGVRRRWGDARRQHPHALPEPAGCSEMSGNTARCAGGVRNGKEFSVKLRPLHRHCQHFAAGTRRDGPRHGGHIWEHSGGPT